MNKMMLFALATSACLCIGTASAVWPKVDPGYDVVKHPTWTGHVGGPGTYPVTKPQVTAPLAPVAPTAPATQEAIMPLMQEPGTAGESATMPIKAGTGGFVR
jgi:hypothetical protein